jgi:hypothetical protein
LKKKKILKIVKIVRVTENAPLKKIAHNAEIAHIDKTKEKIVHHANIKNKKN